MVSHGGSQPNNGDTSRVKPRTTKRGSVTGPKGPLCELSDQRQRRECGAHQAHGTSSSTCRSMRPAASKCSIRRGVVRSTAGNGFSRNGHWGWLGATVGRRGDNRLRNPCNPRVKVPRPSKGIEFQLGYTLVNAMARSTTSANHRKSKVPPPQHDKRPCRVNDRHDPERCID